MGQFSWYAQDTLDPIWNDRDKFKVYMVDPLTGERYEENDYEGYGVFGGRDYYELLATINYPITKYLNPEYFNGDGTIDKTLCKLHNKKLKWENLSDKETSAIRQVGISIEYGDTRNYYMYPVLVHVYGEWIKYKYIKPIHHSGQGWHSESEKDDYRSDMWADDEDRCTPTTHLLNYQKYVYNKVFPDLSITFDNFKVSIQNEEMGNKVNITFKNKQLELEVYGDFAFVDLISSKRAFIETVFNAPKIQHYWNLVYTS